MRAADAPTSKQNLEAAERRNRVLDMRLLGASLRQIAKKVNCSHETVRLDLQRALRELHEEQTDKMEHLRGLELSRLDLAWQAIANKVLEGDLAAIDRFVKLSERRAKLLGMDEPTKISLPVNGLGDMTNEDLQRIVAARQGTGVSGDPVGHAGDGEN